ncbi:DNA polymerase III subunit delta [Candidatus Phytoplasma tritici]|uniref:DNA polymerase III subunit delta n=1 Tax=Candidatus Phytoplasma tritici TaxID=321961 RepID=UPI000419E61F|nr:DNA polymerase III subunit delta [Candidatus Phytoplasma tritici]
MEKKNNIHLIWGKQRFFLEKKIKKIINVCKQQQLDVVYYCMQKDLLTELKKELQTTSLIENIWKKVVLVDHSEILFQKKPQEIAFLISYLQNPYNNLDLYFFAEKTTKTSEVQKIWEKHCLCKTTKSLEKKDFFNYIIDVFQKDGFKIDTKAIQELVSKTNHNLYLLHQEITKIKLCQSNDKNITWQLVQKINSFNKNDNIFGLINLFLKQNYIDAYQIYQTLKMQKINAFHVINRLTHKIKELLLVKELLQQKNNLEEVQKVLSISQGKLFFLMKEAKLIETPKLNALFLDLIELEYKIKAGFVNKDIGLEMFLLGKQNVFL